MTKSKEELAREQAKIVTDEIGIPNTPEGIAHRLGYEHGFIAGYDARQSEVDELKYKIKASIAVSNSLALNIVKISELIGFKGEESDEMVLALDKYIQELKKDRDRLNWMIEKEAMVSEENKGFNYWCEIRTGSRIRSYCESTPREAIDAAMKEHKE